MAAAFARDQREQDVHHCRKAAAADIGNLRRRQDGGLCRAAGQGEQAGQRHVGDVVSGLERARPGLPEAGNRTVDETGIACRQRLRSEAEPFHHARTELLQNHVGRVDQLQHLLARGRILEIELDAGLAAIEHGVERACRPCLGRKEAHVLATRPLDLDDLRSRLGQHQAGQRPGQQRAEIEHGDPGKRLLRHVPGLLPDGRLLVCSAGGTVRRVGYWSGSRPSVIR